MESDSDSETVWETVWLCEREDETIQWEVVKPNREVVNQPYVDTGLDVFGCQFCDHYEWRASKYYVLNSKTCYVACGDCKQKAVQLVGRINRKIEDTMDMFLTYYHVGDKQVMIYGEIYKLQSGTATAVYDQTDPREVTEQNFSVQVMTDNPVGQRKTLYLDGTNVIVSQNSIF
jgi:hypothetical protein